MHTVPATLWSPASHFLSYLLLRATTTYTHTHMYPIFPRVPVHQPTRRPSRRPTRRHTYLVDRLVGLDQVNAELPYRRVEGVPWGGDGRRPFPRLPVGYGKEGSEEREGGKGVVVVIVCRLESVCAVRHALSAQVHSSAMNKPQRTPRCRHRAASVPPLAHRSPTYRRAAPAFPAHRPTHLVPEPHYHPHTLPVDVSVCFPRPRHLDAFLSPACPPSSMLLADMADGGSARCYPAAARAASGRGERWKEEVGSAPGDS